MNKGKKFNAAEKHFLKKEQVYKTTIKELETDVFNYKKQVEFLTKDKESLKEEIVNLNKNLEDIKLQLEKIKELLPLSPEELNTYIKNQTKELETKEILETLLGINKYL